MRETGAASIALKMGAVTLLLLPLIIASDFYGAKIPFLEAIFPGGFYTVSIIFLLWSVLMIAERAPALFRGPSRLPGATLGITPDPEILARLGISDRERDVLVLLLQGKSYAEIATTLFISLATVKTHIGHLYRKAGAGSKMELAQILMTA
jgi:DNA-binding CsgD family transcriptional regulator